VTRGNWKKGDILAGVALAALWIADTFERKHNDGASTRPERAQQAIDRILPLGPVVAVFVLGLGMFGLGWVASDLYFIGLVVLFIAGIGFVVWLTKVVPWPRP
jgi:hypothetical protein